MSETDERDYRATLNLPQTEFPMRADLPKREPDRVAWWKQQCTFARRLAKNKADGNPHWILHDGPPYANGELHMGHFLNMVLKDVFVKIALLDGKQTPFVPGWDMHGLPIELETLKHLGIKDFHSIDPIELREKCKERALYWLDRQRDVRVRMGNFGDWDHPYMTIAPEFEATIVETLATLAEKEQLYRGLRSTLWCIHDETALAEAEIEYENKTSPSVYVRFKASDEQRAELLSKFGAEQHGSLSVLIWTTTPWTLPANVAIALRADAEYGLYRVGDELLVLATALAPKALGDAFATATRVGAATGAQLDGLAVRHPFLDRDSLLVLADYVELETGTGAVHTAPGHGADDFDTGIKYNLPILNPVDARGIFTQEAGPYAGMHIWKANKQIVEDLRASGALWRMHEYEHSYPHCWRCHNPVIFRATAQWFISLDMNHLRQNALDAIDKVAYTPEWGQNRQSQMIETHPEWCVSRQRTWGTPIPALVCTGCNDSFLDPAVARRAAARFRVAGAGTWWSDPLDTFVPAGSTVCPKCGSTEFEREKNIVDIWFESGVTHFAVLGTPDLPWPSDLVLEGGDQYRGWFRSSLLTAVAVKGTAPYKHVVKNGWVNDEHGRPMSKSKGTGIDARDAMEKWGADVLRLWAASVEFVDDVRFGPTVVTQVGNVYRNLRNRIRFVLSNLYDLKTADVVPREKLEPLDALACDVTDDFADKVVADYHAFGVHDAYLRIVEFDRSMSSLYLDALKDPLYSRAADDPRRRSAQSALLYILRRLLAVSAPVLSFTTEEAWQALSEDLRDAEQSVFDLPLAVTHGRDTAEAVRRWDRLRALRGRVAASTDPRDFEARVSLSAVPAVAKELAALGDGLREALVVSEVTLAENDNADADGIATFEITNAPGAKCKRCWKFRDLGTNKAHPEICTDCADVVSA